MPKDIKVWDVAAQGSEGRDGSLLVCVYVCEQYENVYVCSCLRTCAVQLFPAVLLKYSRQKMMEFS